MKIFKTIILLFSVLICTSPTVAQIGYQVSLLDARTGEPRVNEKTSVVVKITDSKGNVVCDETKSVTSDSFGVLSLTVGNSNTFEKVDWNNLPLSISATVDGILIGSSQILTVPVAEHSKHTGVLTPEILSGKRIKPYEGEDNEYNFSKNGTATYTYYEYNAGNPIKMTKSYKYEIEGNIVYILLSSVKCKSFRYSPESDTIRFIDD